MPSFSEKSMMKLRTCDLRLQLLMSEIIKHFDITILEGHRGEDKQDELVAEGKSQVYFPNSKHNSYPSKAIDIAPYPINWKDRERFTYLAGRVTGLAHAMGYEIRWGGDWDDDTELDDNRFDDLPHFELVD